MREMRNRRAVLALFVTALIAGLCAAGAASASSADVWWNSSWHYRVEVAVNTSAFNRTDWPIEVYKNFTAELQYLSEAGTFDENSTRVIEYNTSTGLPMYEVKSQFDGGWGHWGYNASLYDAANSAAGQMTWLLNGTREAHTEYRFYVYFDTIENGKKAYPNYTSDLVYMPNMGAITPDDEFWFNNSKIAMRVGTGSDGRPKYTSGIYKADLREPNLELFNIPAGQNTSEFVQYLNDSDPPAPVMFDFRRRFNLTVDGPVRRVIEQIGEEAAWGLPDQKTGKGSMTKRYIIYSENQWIKIQQVFTAYVALTRSSEEASALEFGIERAFSGSAMSGTINGTASDPYSWQSEYGTNLPYKGAAVIHINETLPSGYDANSQGYKASFSYDPQERVGITLLPVALAPGKSISETAVLYLYNESSHQPATDLRNRFAHDCNKTQKDPEKRVLVVVAQTEHDIYNRGEVVNLSANVTLDTHNLNSSANATLVYSNGTAMNLTLYDDGATGGDARAGDGVYSNNLTVYPSDPIGAWNLTVRVYDPDDFFLNQDSKLFNVTNEYNVSVYIDNRYGVVNRTVTANVFVNNYRNDVGIGNATNFSCEYNGTAVVNITDWYNGTYFINFSAPSLEGTHNLSCNASKYNNTGVDGEIFYTSYIINTTLAVNLTPDTYIIYNVTQELNQSFAMSINVTNIGGGDAYSTNVSFSYNSSFVPNISFPYSCPIFIPGGSCFIHFNVTVEEGTPPGLYQLNATAGWENLDKTVYSANDTSNVTVAANPILYVAETELAANITHGGELRIGNFSINSTGNYRLENVTVSCISGGACTSLGVEMLPNLTAIVNAGGNLTVWVNVSVPLGQTPGTYNGTINVSCSNTNFDLVNISITVPTSTTWYMTPLSYNKTVRVNETGNILTILINNTGNVDIDFDVTPGSLTNYTKPDDPSFAVIKQDTHNLVIDYNTTGALLGSIATFYNVTATTLNATPSNMNITVNLTIVFGQEINVTVLPEYAEQGNVSMTVNVTDNGGAGITWVRANITRPDGFVDRINFTNATEVKTGVFGAWSLWSVNYTNASVRGNYSMAAYSRDNANGYGSVQQNFTIYAKLVLNINPLSTSYQQGDTGVFRINVTDMRGAPAASASVNVVIRDPNNWLILNYTSTTGADGTIQPSPTFSLSSEATAGSYTWVSNVSYYDSIGNQVANGSTSGSFAVTTTAAGLPLYLDIDVGESYNPGDVAQVYAIVKDRYGLLVSGANVQMNVTNSSGNVVYQLTAIEIAGPAYKANFTLGSNAPYGTYSVLGKASYGGDTGYDADVFAVAEPPATALPLSIEVHIPSIYSPGNNVSIYAVVTDQNGAPVSGANVTFNVTNPWGATLQNLSAVGVNGPAYEANFSLASNATYGSYLVFAKAVNQSYTAYDTAMFYVSGDLHAELAIPSVVYKDKMMTVSLVVLDPATGLTLDPDGINVTLYRTEGYNLDLWQSLNKASFTKQANGFYTYSELIGAGVLTGSYLAVVDVSKGALKDWDMVAFRILQTGPYDVDIPWIASPINRGGTLEFTINMTNMGEGGQDVNVTCQIAGQSNYTMAFSRIAKPTGEADLFNKSFPSGIDLPAGTYTLEVGVTYDPSATPATATTTFQVQEGVAPTPTPPPVAGAGGGGGGGGVAGMPKPTLIVPTEVPINEPFRFKFDCGGCNIEEFVDHIRYVIYPKEQTAPRERLTLGYPFEVPLDPKYKIGDELKVGYTVKFVGYSDTVGLNVFEVVPPIEKGGFINITDIYPTALNIERDKSAYITVTTENSGETDLHDVVVSLDGIPSSWVEVMRGEKGLLAPGDLLNTLVKIGVPPDAESRTYSVKVRSIADENGAERSITVKVFDTKCDLIAFEMGMTTRRMRSVQTEYLAALTAGKNVSAVAPVIDGASRELDRGELLLQDGYCSEAEESNKKADELLGLAETLIREAKVPVAVVEKVEVAAPPPTLLERLPLKWILIGLAVLLNFAIIGLLVYFLLRRRRKVEEEKAIFVPRVAPGAVPEKGTLEYISELKVKKDKIEKLLATIKDQHNKGLISERTYEEIKKKNEERLSEINGKIKELGGKV